MTLQCANTFLSKSAGSTITPGEVFNSTLGGSITFVQAGPSTGISAVPNAFNPGNSSTVNWYANANTVYIPRNTPAGTYNISIRGQDADGQLTCNINQVVVSASSFNPATGNTLAPGTITPDQVQVGATAFASNATSIIRGETGLNITGSSSTGINVECDNSVSSGTLTVQMFDGSVFTATVDCSISNALGCNGTQVLEVEQGASYAATSFAINGTPPYQVVNTNNGPASASNGSLLIDTNATVADYPGFEVVIEDSTGAQVTCDFQLNVRTGGNGGGTTQVGCIDTGDSSITAPGTATAGQTITITTNINPSSGGLAGHYLIVLDASGNAVGFPSFVQTTAGGNEWSLTLPASADCANGTYSVVVAPPAGNTACANWIAGSISVSGCTGTGACNSGKPIGIRYTFDGQTIDNPNQVKPGSIVTVSVPDDQCNCDGYSLTWRPDPDNDVEITLVDGNNRTASFAVPATALKGNRVGVQARCCRQS